MFILNRIFGSLLIILASACAWADVTSLALTDDTYVNANQPDANYGLDSQMVVHSYGPKHALVRFDAATIAGQNITAAMLSFHLNGLKASGTIDLYPVTTGWNESTVTWNTRPTTDLAPATSIAVSVTDVGSRVTVDITSVVARWADGSLPDAGVLLSTENGIKALIGTKEGAAGLEMTLEVETEAAGPSQQAIVIDLSDGYEIIDEPGLYVLNRSWFDVVVPDSVQKDGIVLINASDVSVDLKGFTISGAHETASSVIRIFGDDVTISNGSVISDGTWCVWAGTPFDPVARTRLFRLSLTCQGWSSFELGDFAYVSDIDSHGYGHGLGNDGTIVNSRLRGLRTGTNLMAGDRSEIRGNLFWTAFDVINAVHVGASSLIVDNVFRGDPDRLIEIDGDYSLVLRNAAMHSDSPENPSGILVNGSSNILEGNILNTVHTGITFIGSGNFYGNNRIGAYGAPFAGDVAAQVDWGGNVSFPPLPD